MRATFVHLHGPTLHGFALLVSLGDAQRAATVTAEALIEAIARVDELRHPERAAAWLRRRVLGRLRAGRRRAALSDDERRAALAPLGVADATFDRLALLSTDERAALVAATIERFQPVDVEMVLGRSPSAARRLILRARRRFLFDLREARTFVPGKPASAAAQRGPIGRMVDEVTERSLGPIGHVT